MAVEIGITLVTAAGKLMTELYQITLLKQHNATIVRDIEDFTESLKTDLNFVETKRKTLIGDQAWVVDSLQKDLEDAAKYLQNCRNRGWIKGYWDAKRTKTELSALRQKLSHNFHVKLFFTSLEVIIDKEKRTDDFHSKLLQLSTFTATRSEDVYSSANEIKELLKPLTIRLRREDERFQQLRAEIRALSASSEGGNERSSETQKFLEDILRDLAAEPQTKDDAEYFDPFTCELMCDPVKCEDGLTYDRFSVFKNNAEIPNKFLVIVCDDVSLRSRVFEKFHYEDLDKLMWSKRNSYKMEALAVAQEGHFGEALVSLDNILQWAPNDSECLEMREKMRDAYRSDALNLAADGHFADALIMLKTVLKWSPFDTECFEKYKVIESQLAPTQEDHHQSETSTHGSKVKRSHNTHMECLPTTKMELSSSGELGDQQTPVTSIGGLKWITKFPPTQIPGGAPVNQERKRSDYTPMESVRNGTMELSSSKDMNENQSNSQDYHVADNIEGVLRFSSAQIEEATKDFSVKVAEAGRGAVYYGTIDNQQVAVKKLPDSSVHEAQDFLAQVEILSKICHTNVVALVGYCCEKDHHSLVLDYMPNGTLRNHLYGQDLTPADKLDWQGRINAALDVARGLEYLHFSCKPPITHHDVKSNNIMLDKNLAAKIIDFGVSHVLQGGVTTTIVGPVGGTFGYWDPECLESRTISTKCDVYAFGVVLLELISGCAPSPKLQERAKQATNNRDLAIILDSDIRGIQDKEAVWKLIRLARQCIQINRQDRPDMKDVVRQLEQRWILPSLHMHPRNPRMKFFQPAPKDVPMHQMKKHFDQTRKERSSSKGTNKASGHQAEEHFDQTRKELSSLKDVSRGTHVEKTVQGAGSSTQYSSAQVESATKHFSTKEGETEVGTIYSGVIQTQVVAVKKLLDSSVHDSQEFFKQVKILSRIRHINVVALVGYCYEKDHKSIILDYVPNGTLREHLRGKELKPTDKLDWQSRINVALDVARGLEYLHFYCKPSVIHGDIRSNNIVLDEHSVAKIMDFGLTLSNDSDFENSHSHSTTVVFDSRSVRGGFEYSDSMYVMTGITSPKCDVYAFGIVLLELISGCPPSRKLVEQALRAQQKQDLDIILDSDMKGAYTPKAVWKLVAVANLCTQDERQQRPGMDIVVKALQHCQLNGVRQREMPTPVVVELEDVSSPVSDLHSSWSFGSSGSQTNVASPVSDVAASESSSLYRRIVRGLSRAVLRKRRVGSHTGREDLQEEVDGLATPEVGALFRKRNLSSRTGRKGQQEVDNLATPGAETKRIVLTTAEANAVRRSTRRD